MRQAVLILSVLFWAALASAQQKIAVIDMQKVFTGYGKTRAIEQNLNEQLEIYKEYSARLMNEYKALGEEYEKLRGEAQNVALSEAERENRKLRAIEKAEEIKRKEAEISEYGKSRQIQLKESFDSQRREVLREIKKVVQNKAVLEGLSLVLDKSGVTLNDLPLVLYNSPAVDLTQSVLDELNRAYKPAPAQAPAKENIKK